MEVSALRYSGGIGVHARSPLLRLQSDERLIALTRRGNTTAFEVLVGRYQSRLLAFCRHLLGSREDAEDVLQEVMAAAFNAMVADERPINVRPWLYRIARNRCLNHLRRVQAVASDTMDLHLSDFGASTADKVHKAEEFRLLVDDIHGLPETQRSALVLREMDALSYEQIAEAMDTTVPSVKSLLVRARIGLAEAAEARKLTCEEVRLELGAVAEGIASLTAPVRRHVKDCDRCRGFRTQLRSNNRALAAIFPLGPILLLKKTILVKFGLAKLGVGGAGATGGAATAASGTAAAAATGGSVGTVAVGALTVKAVAIVAAAAVVAVGATSALHHHHRSGPPKPPVATSPVTAAAVPAPTALVSVAQPTTTAPPVRHHRAIHRLRQHRVLATLPAMPIAPATTPSTATPALGATTTVVTPATPVITAPQTGVTGIPESATPTTQEVSTTTVFPAGA